MSGSQIIQKQQSLVSYGEALQERETELSPPTGHEVIVRIRHCGVCHSDVHLQDGYFELGNERKFPVNALHELPHTLGHEIEGEVIALGPDVTDAEIGDRRVVYAWIGCDDCLTCLAGNSHLCNRPQQIGVNVDGGFATHIKVPHSRYLLDYTGISPEQAGSYMCAGLTAYGALKKIIGRGNRGPALIIGAGGVGLMALQFACEMFDQPPIVADIDENKRTQALELGAGSVVDPRDRDQRKAIMKETGGVTGAVDLVGNPKSVEFGMNLLARGGKLVICGLYGGELTYPLPYLPFKSIAVEGSYVGSLGDAREMLELVKAKKLEAIPVTTRPLDEATLALDALRSGNVVGRTVLVS